MLVSGHGRAAWTGELLPSASPLKLPWGPCLYHQHPNRCLSSCHGIDALFSNEGVRPLLMEHKPSPGCGRKEGDIVLLTDVQDQLETCWGRIARAIELVYTEVRGRASTQAIKPCSAKAFSGAHNFLVSCAVPHLQSPVYIARPAHSCCLSYPTHTTRDLILPIQWRCSFLLCL